MFRIRNNRFDLLVAALVVTFTLSLGASLVHASGSHSEPGLAGYTWVDEDGEVVVLDLRGESDDAAAMLD